MDETSTQSSPRTKSAERQRIPSRRISIFCAVLIALIGVVRTTPWVGDNAIVNILTLILAFVVSSTLVVWLLFFSGYRRATRALIGMGGFAAIAYSISQYQLDHVSGELIPTFRRRNTPAADELLTVPVASAQTSVNLADTGPLDFPQFLGPHRDARLSAASLSHDWAGQQPRQIWRQRIGAAWSSFSVVNGFAVTMEQRGEEELVTCYDIQTGGLVWSHGWRARYSTVLGGTGPRSTPTIADGMVFAVGAMGRVVCLAGATGRPIWEDDLLERYQLTAEEELKNIGWGRSASPLVVDDLVVVPAGGRADGPRSLIAYRKESGEVVWQSGNQQIGFCSPIVATLAGLRQVITINEESISGCSPTDGAELWDFSWPGKNTVEPSISQPVVLPGDRIFASKGYRGGAIVLQLSYLEEGGIKVEEVWRNRRVMKTKFTNVVAQDGYIYGLSDGILECIDAATGKRVWKRGRYYHGQILGVDDVLLVQSENGDIALVDATPEQFREVARFSAIEGNTSSNPCLYGQFLLVRNATEAACYELPLLAAE